MHLAGVPKVVRFRGLAAYRQYDGLGALPENLQNSLYPVGYQNSNYNDVIGNPQWNTMKEIAAKPYGVTAYAGNGVQNPWGTSASAGYAFSNTGVMVRESGETIASTGTVTGGGGGAAKGRGKVQMEGLSGLGDVLGLATAFPYRIKEPFITGNNFWYTGQPTLNRGEPKYYNDAQEFLRSALVDSDWDRVEAWLGWALQNGMTRDKLTMFDFGRMKYTGSGLTKKMYPFSKADIRSFYERFLRFTATSSPADRTCIQNKYAMAMKAVDSSPRNQFGLHLSDCPLTTSWEHALLTMVAMVAIPVALAAVATLAVGAAAAGAGAGAAGGAAAGGAAAGAGAGAGAVAATVIPAGIEVVTVAATALPVIGASTAIVSAGAAIAAGSVVAAAAPPPLAPPEIAPPPAGIETVTVSAAAIPAVTPAVPVAIAGSAIGAGAAIVATSTPPPIVQAQTPPPSDVIETVTVEAAPISAPPPPIIAASAIPGVVSIALDAPTISVPEPNPIYEDPQPTVADTVKNGLIDAVEQYGADYVSSELVDYLTGLLGRPPTQSEIDQYQDWLNDGANPDDAPGNTTAIVGFALLGALLVYAAADAFGGKPKKPRRR